MTSAERSSRQNLVVPPHEGRLPVVLGAIICGCIGFGVVWALGIGRSPDRVPSEHVHVESRGAVGDTADERWHSRDADDLQGDETPPADVAPPPAPRAFDGSVTPASFAGPATEPDLATPALSRFSASSRVPDDAMVEPETAPPGRLALPPDTEIAPALDPLPADADPAAIAAPLGDPEPLEPGCAADTPFTDGVATPDEAPAAAAETTGPPSASATAGAPAELPVETSATTRLVPNEVPFEVTAPAATPAVAPVPASSAPPAAAVPFASAPALVPGGVPASPESGRTPIADVSGQGRPGPMHLEGVQSPQLTVEKRGPREVQVGKPARYEILVRNVGAAAAHDVTLRDSVPFGTALVTTTPPAVPGRGAAGVTSDELVWNLGALPPGGQARVVIELMPQAEGEIGSVASVSFRADASIRSRSTKPALTIEATEPKPVLIGRDLQLTITVSNPGSGVATGVVLEGFLPENVSHRSGNELEFDVGQLKPGESRTIELVLGTRGPGVHTARLAARADGGIEVQQAVRLEVTAPTLELELDMPVRRFLQRPATCSIAMVNAGTAPARAVELAAQLPPGMKFVKANNAGWHDERTHRVLWNLEELPPGETGTVELVVMPVELGPQKITAAARSADGLADQAAHVCDVEGLAALVFEVTDSEDPIEVEGVTEYVVRVGNQGTKAATGVRLTATLLGDLEPVEAQGPAGHRVENLTVSFEPLAKLAPAEEAVYRVRARGRSAGDQRVQVQLTSEDHPAPITKEETTRVYLDR